jgi:hypothetical protein
MFIIYPQEKKKIKSFVEDVCHSENTNTKQQDSQDVNVNLMRLKQKRQLLIKVVVLCLIR